MKKRFNIRRMGIVWSAGIFAAGMAACGAGETMEQSSAQKKAEPSVAAKVQEAADPVGTLLLSINPEIEMEYDSRGNVLTLEGINSDGKKVVGAYPDFEGKACREVVGDLVTEIHEAGYFAETIGGHEKNIILKLEKGSQYPDEDFMEEIAEEVRLTVEANQIGSRAVPLDDDDYDDVWGEKGYIDAQAAREIVAQQMERTDLQFVEKEYELDDGVYEIEFVMDGKEYEYEVNAVTGKIQEAEIEEADDIPAAPSAVPSVQPSETNAATPIPADDNVYDDDWDDGYDDWDDGYDDDWDDSYDDNWDDGYDDDWDDSYDDNWDDSYDDDWDDGYDDWDDGYDDDWDDGYDDDWDDGYDDDWDDGYDDDWDDGYDDDDDDDWDDDDDDDWDDDDDDDWDD